MQRAVEPRDLVALAVQAGQDAVVDSAVWYLDSKMGKRLNAAGRRARSGGLPAGIATAC